jgi:RNA polymerase sigma factor (sigma-70 family)
MTPKEEFSAFCKENISTLCEDLARKFRRLAGEAEDLVSQAVLQTLEKIRMDKDFRPENGWRRWVWVVASNRALDRLKQCEHAAYAVMMPQGHNAEVLQPVDPALSPSEACTEKERRERQSVGFSEVLREFCRWCESRPNGHKMKEVYERSLRGQKPAAIAKETGLARGTVDQHLKRARDWLLDRVRQADVHQSVFLTLHRRKPEE